MSLLRKICLTALIAVAPLGAWAKLGGRVLVSQSITEQAGTNSYLRAANVEGINRPRAYALEMGIAPSPRTPAEFAFRLNYRDLSTGTGGNTAKITSYSLPLIVRLYALNKPRFRADFFGGVGISTASFEVRSGGSQGSYAVPDGQHCVMGLAAGSVSYGWSGLQFVAEAGYQWERNDNVRASGTKFSTGLGEIDFSGPFVSLGIAFRFGGEEQKQRYETTAKRRNTRGLRPMPGNEDDQPNEELDPDSGGANDDAKDETSPAP